MTPRPTWPLALAALTAVAAAQDSDLTARLEARVAHAVANEGVIGLEVHIALGADVVLQRAAGRGVDGEPRSVGDALRAPSLLRPLASLAVLRLVGETVQGDARFSLERPLAAYLPAAAFEDKAVTVRRVLAGTSGVTPYDSVLTRDQRAQATAASLLEVTVAHGLLTPPGHCFDPNESEVLLLGALVEALTGGTLQAALTELFETAGLASTAFLDEDAAPPRVAGAAASELDFERRECASLAPFGEDRLTTTVPDVARLVRAVADRVLLDEAQLTELLAPQPVEHGGLTGYGLGVDLVRLADLDGVTVGGAGVGGALHLVRYPGPDVTIVLAATAGDAPLADLGRDLTRLLLGLRPPGVLDLAQSADAVARWVGGYQLGCDRLVVAQNADGRLVLGGAHRMERVLLYQGEHRFIAADDGDCAYEFLFRDEDGRASTLVLMEHGQRTEAVRID